MATPTSNTVPASGVAPCRLVNLSMTKVVCQTPLYFCRLSLSRPKKKTASAKNLMFGILIDVVSISKQRRIDYLADGFDRPWGQHIVVLTVNFVNEKGAFDERDPFF